MYILINGSFGIGKTTVAHQLQAALPRSVIYDPEGPGFVVRRLPLWALGLKRRPDDYQEIPLWRRWTVDGARKAHRRAKTVIIPMAFSDSRWFDEIVTGVSADAPTRVFCLAAPLAFVRGRLDRRAGEGGLSTAWAYRRAEECCAAHATGAFGELVDAAASPQAIVADLVRRLDAA